MMRGNGGTMKNLKIAMYPLIFLLLAGTGICEMESLYASLSRKAVVSVYVAPPTDVSELKAVDREAFKKALEDTLLARKSIKFQIAPKPSEADLTVDTKITEYYWTDHDPVDMLVGVGGTALDAARVEKYARLQAVLTVTDAKTSRLLWTDKLIATITGDGLTQEEGPARISKDMAEIFVRTCFGKRRR